MVALDQLTKSWAVAALDGRSIELIGSSVRLDLVHNEGSAFSIITGWAPALAVLAIGLVAFIVRMSRHESDPWLLVALSLVLGGALGNLTDRVLRDPGWFRGAVIDFIDVGAWPTFNVADSAITVGAVLLLLRGWRAGERER